MKYDKIIEAKFVKRPNQFIAHVEIDGREKTVHVKNTGRCKELLVPGAKVILEDCSHVPTRKTKYSLIAVWKGNMLVNMDSQAPNMAVFSGLKNNLVPSLTNLKKIQREVKFGNSRFDLYFESERDKGFIEVKGVTLEKDSVAMFPDAPTDRGAKHVLEMIDVVNAGYRGIIFFLVQMQGPKLFHPNFTMDEKFSKALMQAEQQGVEIMVYDSLVTPNSLTLNKAMNYTTNSP